MSAPARFFVYYRIRPEVRQEAEARVAALFGAVARDTGVPGRLLCRLDEPLLWMEVFEPVADADAFSVVLDAAAAESQFATVIAPGSARKVERFQDVVSCA